MTRYPGLLASPVASGNELSSAYPNLLGARSSRSASRSPALKASNARTPFLQEQANLINGAIPNDLFAPPVTTQTTRSATQAPRIAGLGTAYDQNQQAQKESLTDWTKNYLASNGAAKANTGQEVGAVGSFYGSGPGSVRSDLDRLATRSNAASNLAAMQALAKAQRQNNLNRMIHGNGSFTDNAYASQATQIAVDNANKKAAQDLANYQYVKSGQMNLLGRRNELQDAYTNRGLVPIDVNNRYLGQQSNLLGGINSLENANSVYQTMTPDDAINRRISLLNSLNSFGNNPDVFNDPQQSALLGTQQPYVTPLPSPAVAPTNIPYTPQYIPPSQSELMAQPVDPYAHHSQVAPNQSPLLPSSSPYNYGADPMYQALGQSGIRPQYDQGVRVIQSQLEYDALPSGVPFKTQAGGQPQIKP